MKNVTDSFINPLNAELNPIRHLLALVGARHIVHVSRLRVNGRGDSETLTKTFYVRNLTNLDGELFRLSKFYLVSL